MADMIKFFKGLEASLPASGVNGALYITTDEGAIYLGTGTGMKRLGDFVQVANVAALPAKAHESCLYYCVAENILAKWNGTEWKQINKQPTAEELKGLLGLGALAYKSEVAEDDLNAALKEKVNAAAEGNHSHSNKDVIDGITADKVTAWDAAEGNAKGYADGLNTAMNTRVEALEAIDHDHTNKALLDTYTQTEADLADAVAKKHAHTFNETELNKIAEGDVAKWNGVAADHLTSADKTTLENSIKEAKKAGTDANTNIETYKVSNDARVLAVEEDITEITGENGILAQAKTYTDGKDSAMNTRVAALEAAAPTHALKTEVEAVDAKFAQYNTTVAQKAIDDAQDAEIAKKVAKADYETDKATFATKTELGDVDAKFANYKTAADQKLIDDAQDVEIGKKVDKVEGKSLVDDAEIAKLAGVSEGANKVEASTNGKIKIDGVDTTVYVHPDKHTVSEISDFETKIASYDYATKTEAKGYADAKDEAIAAAQKAADDLAVYVGTFTASEGVDTVVKYIDAKTANIASDERVDGIDERLTQAEKDIDAIEADYLKAADKTELEGKITAEKQRAEGIEGGLRTDVDAIKGDYLKAADKTELEGKITAEETRATGVESGLDARIKAVEDDYLKASDKEDLQTQINTIMNNPDTEGVINSINEFTQYIADHGTIADGFRTDIDKNKEDIAANAKAIEDHESLAVQTYETKEDATAKFNEVKAAVDAIPQADWNQNDEAAADYVKNRTHYDSLITVPFIQDMALSAGTEGAMGTTKWTYEYALEFPFNPSLNYYLSFNGETYPVSGYNANIKQVYFQGIPHPADSTRTMSFTVGEGTIQNSGLRDIAFDREDLTFSIYLVEGEIKQLDEKFIPDTIARTSAVDSVDARVQTLEAIDHDAYVAADTALKTELQAEIDADVKALADGQVKTNTEAIATKANAADVYAKTETFTKDEVNAAIAAAVEQAHTWGEF